MAVPASGSLETLRSRRVATPTLLAWATACIGIVSIVSAVTPEMADRSRVVRGVLSQGVPDLARTLALALGLGLLWLARGLARRKHRAWQRHTIQRRALRKEAAYASHHAARNLLPPLRKEQRK